MSLTNLLRCARTCAVLALGLGITAAPGCKRADQKTAVPAAAATRIEPGTRVTCPKGAPRMKIKDARTVVFDCPEGGDPIKTEVAVK